MKYKRPTYQTLFQRLFIPLLLLFSLQAQSQNCQASYFHNLSLGGNGFMGHLFLNQSTGAYTSSEIDLGDGTVINNPPFITYHNYTTPGDYLVCLSVWDSTGACNSTYCDSISVTLPCNIDFDATPSGNFISLNNTSTPFGNNITNWIIDGSYAGSGNNFTALLSNGQYDICMFVSYDVPGQGFACQDTVCQTITVGPPTCNANFTFAGDINEYNTFQFTSQATASNLAASIQYHWDFGDGSTSTVQNPNYQFLTGGEYEVCLSIEEYLNGAVTCIDTFCQLVNTAGFNNTCNLFYEYTQTGNQVNAWIPANLPTPTVVEWYLNGGSQNIGTGLQGTFILPSAAGTYTLCADYEVPNGGAICYGTYCENITITQQTACQASFGYSVSASDIFSFDASNSFGESIISYFWDFGDGFTQIDDDPYFDHTFTNSGTYTVCLSIVDSLGCSSMVCENITITGTICEAYFQPIQDTSVCGFYFLNLSGAPSSSLVQYSWDYGDGAISSNYTGYHVYSDDGTYNVCLTVTVLDFGGNIICSDDYCQTVSVVCNNDPCIPELVFLVSGFNLTAYVAPGPNSFPIEMEWYYTNANGDSMFLSGSQGFSETFAAGGLFEICLAYNTPGTACQGNICELVLIGDVCEASFTYEQSDPFSSNPLNIFFTNTSLGHDLVEVDFGDGTIENYLDTVFDHTYPNPGLYDVCLTIANSVNGCTDIYCETIVVNDPLCFSEECVFPGDANHDGTANLFDLLYVGLAYDEVAFPRTNASDLWYGQPSTNWFPYHLNPDSINYKHSDCDGDGTIDFQDINPIIMNYQKIHDGQVPLSPNEKRMPSLSVRFDTDSIYSTPGSTEIVLYANVVAGTNFDPLSNIHGLAFSLEYNDNDFDESIFEFEYKENDLLGNANELLSLNQEFHTEDQFDLAFSRTDHQNGSSLNQQVIVRMRITLIGDVIGLLPPGTGTLPFNMNLLNIMAVDAQGQVVELNSTGDQVVISSGVTGVNPNLPNDAIQIHPNPATDQIWIQTGDYQPLQVQIFNTIGQEIMNQPLTQKNTNIQLPDLPKGIYLVTVQTEEGMLTQRLLID